MPDETGLAPEEAPGTVVIPEASEDPGSSEAPRAEARSPHMANPARRRALMPWAVAAGLVVLLGAVGIGLTYSPVFHAKTITVSGERRLSEQRILRMAGIRPGTDIFHLDLEAAERRLEQDPWIADAVVTRHLPSTVTVNVAERTPVALARSAGGTLMYLAVDGRVLAPADGAPRLPEVLAADPQAAASGAVVAKALPASLVPEVASITVGAEGSISIRMRSGVTAAYGDGAEAQAKGQALKAIVAYAASKGRVLVSVNIEVPGAPTAVFSDTPVSSPHARA